MLYRSKRARCALSQKSQARAGGSEGIVIVSSEVKSLARPGREMLQSPHCEIANDLAGQFFAAIFLSWRFDVRGVVLRLGVTRRFAEAWGRGTSPKTLSSVDRCIPTRYQKFAWVLQLRNSLHALQSGQDWRALCSPEQTCVSFAIRNTLHMLCHQEQGCVRFAGGEQTCASCNQQ